MTYTPRELAAMVVQKFNDETVSDWNAELLPDAASADPDPIIECTIRWQYGLTLDEDEMKPDIGEMVQEGWVMLLSQVLASLDYTADQITDYLAEVVADEIIQVDFSGLKDLLTPDNDLAAALKDILGSEGTLGTE